MQSMKTCPFISIATTKNLAVLYYKKPLTFTSILVDAFLIDFCNCFQVVTNGP